MNSKFVDLVVGAFNEFKAEHPFWSKNVHIDGIEVTQAIQYYHSDKHLTDVSDRGPDNSIMLFMHKPALVRVYIRNVLSPPGTQVVGQLDVEGTFQPYATVTQKITFNPNGQLSVMAQSPASYDAERGNLATTLNFLLPAFLISGHVKLTARIWRADDYQPQNPDDSVEIGISAFVLQTLALRGIMIRYNGPNAAGTANLDLAAPAVADLNSTSAYAVTRMPVQAWTNNSIGGNLTWGTPLTGMATNPGGCSQQWINLNADVAEARDNDGNRPYVIYYGLLPVGTPIANVFGCESHGVASGRTGDGGTMAHEIGHSCGLEHAPCGTNGDEDYPAYEPYDAADTPTGLLGEYGVDINLVRVHRPNEMDLMSYCNSNLFSLYHYRRMFYSTRLAVRFPYQHLGPVPSKDVDPYVWPWEEQLPPSTVVAVSPPVPLISLIGIVTKEDEIDVRSMTRVTANMSVADAQRTDYVFQLLDHQGGVIAEAPLVRLRSQGACGCGGVDARDRPPYLVRGVLPDVAAGGELRVLRLEAASHEGKTAESRTIWSRKSPKTKPRIGKVRASLKGDEGALHWVVERGNEPLRFSIQFSKDEGRSWNGLAVGLAGDSFDFEPAHLPAGKLIFRILAHDGFHTTTAVSKPVTNPTRPPIPLILHPQEGAMLAEGQVVRLWGSIVGSAPRDRDDESFRWLIDGKDVGRGEELWIAAPPAGRHRCELRVKGKDGSARATVAFETFGENRKKR